LRNVCIQGNSHINCTTVCILTVKAYKYTKPITVKLNGDFCLFSTYYRMHTNSFSAIKTVSYTFVYTSYKTTETKIQSTLHKPAPYDLNHRHVNDHIATVQPARNLHKPPDRGGKNFPRAVEHRGRTPRPNTR